MGNLKKAKSKFDKVPNDYYLVTRNDIDADSYNGYANIPNTIFSVKPRGNFNSLGYVEATYLNDFPFLKNKMNKKELAETLIQLKKIAKKNNDKGAKANYLLGNFFYNTTSLGFYRHILRFDLNNRNSEKFNSFYGWHYGQKMMEPEKYLLQTNYTSKTSKPFTLIISKDLCTILKKD